MLRLPNNSCSWPIDLNPWQPEDHRPTFGEWWDGNQNLLQHLPADLCEQWIYRHWTHSPFAFLPLATLAWERRLCSGAELLSEIFRADARELAPEFDYRTFQRRGGADRHATALALDTGTWDYPVVLLTTPSGVNINGTEHSLVRQVLVEGHQRHRYLNALHVLQRPPAGPHEVIVLMSPAAA